MYVQYGCPVFKWQSHVTWRTIQIPNILDHKQAFSVLGILNVTGVLMVTVSYTQWQVFKTDKVALNNFVECKVNEQSEFK